MAEKLSKTARASLGEKDRASQGLPQLWRRYGGNSGDQISPDARRDVLGLPQRRRTR